MSLANQLAIIAGGIGGIGSAAGKLLRSRGAKLALLYMPAEHHRVAPVLRDVYGTAAQSDGSVRAYSCDITSAESVGAAFSAIEADAAAAAAPPRILVNAAGYVGLSPLDSTSAEDALRHYAINLLGPMLTAQAFVGLRGRAAPASAPAPGARIVNLASQAAHVALYDHAAYCASKAGLLGLTRCMASEWGPRGVTANSISPGPAWTALGRKAWADREQREAYQAAVPTGRFAEPEEVAEAILFLCGESARNINGADIRLDGGFTAR